MHPKQICNDVESMGSCLVLDGDDLYIEHPENIYPEMEDVIKSYKVSIINYLKGDYSKKEYAVMQTIEKIIGFYRGREQEINSKINAWLNQDDKSIRKIMTLFIVLSRNGWTGDDPIDQYRDDTTDELSLEIFNKAMAYFKGG